MEQPNAETNELIDQGLVYSEEAYDLKKLHEKAHVSPEEEAEVIEVTAQELVEGLVALGSQLQLLQRGLVELHDRLEKVEERIQIHQPKMVIPRGR